MESMIKAWDLEKAKIISDAYYTQDCFHKLPQNGLVDTFVKGDLYAPNFKPLEEKVHNWKKYVPGVFKQLWDEIPLSARVCIVLMAEEQASAEEWD